MLIWNNKVKAIWNLITQTLVSETETVDLKLIKANQSSDTYYNILNFSCTYFIDMCSKDIKMKKSLRYTFVNSSI